MALGIPTFDLSAVGLAAHKPAADRQPEPITAGPRFTSVERAELIHLIQPAWADQKRHALVLAISGWLARNAVPEADARAVLLTVADLAEDGSNAAEIKRWIAGTYKAARAGKPVAGWSKLTDPAAPLATPETAAALDAFMRRRLGIVVVAVAPAPATATPDGGQAQHHDMSAPAPTAHAGGCPACDRTRRALAGLTAKLDRVVRVLRSRDLKPAARVALISGMLELERRAGAAPGRAVPLAMDYLAKQAGINRNTVSAALHQYAGPATYTVTEATPAADVPRSRGRDGYKMAHFTPAAPTERDRDLPLSARMADRILEQVAPRPDHANAGKPRGRKLRHLLPEVIPDCSAGCPAETPLHVVITCAGCGEIVYMDRHVCAPTRTVHKEYAGIVEGTPPERARPPTVHKEYARFQSAATVSRRRQALRALEPQVGPPRPRPLCPSCGQRFDGPDCPICMPAPVPDDPCGDLWEGRDIAPAPPRQAVGDD